MDWNKTALIVGGLLLAAFIALPLLKPSSKRVAPPTAAEAAAAAAGPNLTMADLVGSTWQANAPKVGDIHVLLNGDGTFRAAPISPVTAQLLQSATGLSEIVGNWTLNGTNLNLTASAGGQNININGQIKGQSITVNGQPAYRVQ